MQKLHIIKIAKNQSSVCHKIQYFFASIKQLIIMILLSEVLIKNLAFSNNPQPEFGNWVANRTQPWSPPIAFYRHSSLVDVVVVVVVSAVHLYGSSNRSRLADWRRWTAGDENFWKIEIFHIRASRARRQLRLAANRAEAYLARVYARRPRRHNRFTYSGKRGRTVVLR